MRKVLMAIWIALLPVLATGCAAMQPAVTVRLGDPDPAVTIKNKQIVEGPVLRVAVSSILSPKETLTVYQPLLDYLSGQLGYPVVLLQRRTYREVNDLLQNGGADVAFVCSGGYVAGSQMFGMEILAQPEVNGRNTYQSYIIVQAENAARNIFALQGKTFAFTDPMSFSGRIAPVYMLVSRGFDSDNFFSRTFYTYSHDNSIRAVADGIVEAAAVDSMVYDRAALQNQELAQRVKVIDRSPLVGNPPVVAGPHTDERLKNRLRALLLAMHEDKAGRAALISLGYDRFVQPDEATYVELKSIWLMVRNKL